VPQRSATTAIERIRSAIYTLIHNTGWRAVPLELRATDAAEK
jgi:hypothetical protein